MKHQLSIVVLLGLLAACGGTDSEATTTSQSSDSAEQEDDRQSEPTADLAGDQSTSSDSAPPVDGDSASDDGVVIVNLGDLPAECRQIMGDFLREIEPIVNAIDWQNATLGSLDEFETTFDEPSNRLDVDMEASGCDQYNFGPETEDGMAFTIELARVEAPGVIGWLEFIRDLGDVGDPVDGVPADCDGAIAFVAELIENSSGMSEVPLAQFIGVTSVITTIQTECPPEQAAAFFADPAFVAWGDG